MRQSDQIVIKDLRIACHVGVPDEELAKSQELEVSVTMFPLAQSGPINDDIDRTVDYYAVSLRLEEEAQKKPRRLIETLAEDLAQVILNEFAVFAVTLEIKKYILPNTRYVGVTVTRSQGDLIDQ
ncbi:dihydroneopterin aldolase [Verrucomicrobiaceae bacterium N1E253]|uniref:dihydroneopterin aldolase n=1 Tax=Oceaniferula marina TaxID=2748318 RepID=A0A851G9P1_9BACT|nr:dihydroneopterin aldolase [Oceaniferula marina]NWK54323.1 dihydroneopterin aldolase [Oceaniferula marina]